MENKNENNVAYIKTQVIIQLYPIRAEYSTKK